MTKQKLTCKSERCTEAPYRVGYCRKHYEEQTLQETRRAATIRALHNGVIGDRLPDDVMLREEWLRLTEKWDRACWSIRTKRDQESIPLDEAEFALEWCIALANKIIEAEIAQREGKVVASNLTITRDWVWKRFNNLEAGLRSNGTS